MSLSCTAVLCAELSTVWNTIMTEFCLQKLHLVCTHFMKYIFRETKFSQNCDSDGRHLAMRWAITTSIPWWALTRKRYLSNVNTFRESWFLKLSYNMFELISHFYQWIQAISIKRLWNIYPKISIIPDNCFH